MSISLQIAKWGNSLAMRLPSDLVRRFGLREGDTVEARLTTDGALTIQDEPVLKASLAKELTPVRDTVPVDTDLVLALRRKVSRLMTDCVGMVRNESDLQHARAELETAEREHHLLLDHWDGRPLRRMIQVCRLAVESALLREETRGAHIREDFPDENRKFDGHITLKKGAGAKIVQWI